VDGLTLEHRCIYTFSMDALSRATREVRERCLCTKLRQASRALTQVYDQAISPSGLRATQLTLLVALAQAPEAPLGRLAEALVMDRTTLTRNLAPLLRDGLAEERAAADGRVRGFALTPKGKRALERALPAWKTAQARMLRALDREALEALERALGLLMAEARV